MFARILGDHKDRPCSSRWARPIVTLASATSQPAPSRDDRHETRRSGAPVRTPPPSYRCRYLMAESSQYFRSCGWNRVMDTGLYVMLTRPSTLRTRV